MIQAILLVSSALLLAPAQEVVVWQGYPPDMRLSGRVVSEQGEPVEGAALALHALVPFESAELGAGTSGPDGRFDLAVRAFEWKSDDLVRAYLSVSATGFAPSMVDRIPVPPPALDLGDVVVFAPVDLTGLVVDSLGRPVAGAEIHAALGRASGPYQDHAEREPIAVTDANGEFACRNLPPGVVTLGASAPSFADGVLEPVTLDTTANRVRFELAEGRASELVACREDGAPLAGALVRPMGDLPWWSRIRSPGLPGFWRGKQLVNASGRIRFDGLSSSHAPQVVVSAFGFDPATVELDGPQCRVILRASTRLMVSAMRAADDAPVALHLVEVRNSQPIDRICGNGEALNWYETWSNSAAVRVLAPNRWEIQWNASICEWLRPGVTPTRVSATAEDGTHAWVDVPETVRPGELVELELRFGAPAAMSGRVLDRSGKLVSLALGFQIDHRRTSYWTTISAANGTFEFDHIDAGDVTLRSMDQRWTLSDSTDTWELEPGAALTGIVVRAHPAPRYLRPTTRVRLTIAGQLPREPLLVALDSFGSHLPDGVPRGFAWTDADGWLEFESSRRDSFHVVPKHRVGAETGGWRDFSAEFPAHGKSWPWVVTLPARRGHEPTIDLLRESEWDRVAPPDD